MTQYIHYRAHAIENITASLSVMQSTSHLGAGAIVGVVAGCVAFVNIAVVLYRYIGKKQANSAAGKGDGTRYNGSNIPQCSAVDVTADLLDHNPGCCDLCDMFRRFRDD